VKLTVLAVGKLRDAWVKDGCDEYARRVRARLPLEIIEVKRADELLRRVPPRARLWALDERGTQLSSEELAARLKRHMDTGEPAAFVVGGADGLPAALLERAAVRWSLGRLTLPHRLCRLILLEQLYRALSILRGEPYHRA
jgi:23S rRNA (pseudouridine1915-N3)-methyltransferase